MTRRNWTDEEIMFLKETIGYYKIQTIAQKLNRTVQAVLSKMKRLGISNTREQTGFLTTCQLANALQVDPTTVREWIKRHDLKCVKRATRCEQKYYLIQPEDFWSWAEVNRDRIDFSKIDYLSLLPVPEWYKDEKNHKKETSYKVWSKKEEKSLLLMMSSGYTLKEVAAILNRSMISVQRKYNRL
ncbi:helix-turn-helix domain-containing protein [Fredinandcohnia quinoae]|uniref:Helix-turn-helix domain-containing protein n=1 Tax=Fredinandcohnia quinoae TaxID=2918902 RepID=A0AAW5E8Y3_9BACI|nr:helix-turn-helix domain-containing protein [Fredinandcohnia sp. SECRCQ15]MCH1625224.1 helix-turn-helix domain-containing protein [Fredinandcohnia sp. SECRCQ15]